MASPQAAASGLVVFACLLSLFMILVAAQPAPEGIPGGSGGCGGGGGGGPGSWNRIAISRQVRGMATFAVAEYNKSLQWRKYAYLNVQQAEMLDLSGAGCAPGNYFRLKILARDNYFMPRTLEAVVLQRFRTNDLQLQSCKILY